MKILMWLIKALVSIAPLHFLLACVDVLGWDVCVDTKEETVQGLIVGTQEFIDSYIGEDKC